MFPEEDNGYIVLSKEFISNCLWFHGAKMLHVFIWILANASLDDGYYLLDKVKRGSIVSTNERIANACGITIANVRTALSKLELSGKISRERRNHYQIITVNDFDSYIADPQ